MDGRIFRLTSYISETLDHDWTVGEMARFVGVSASHLQRLFKVQTRSAPIAFLKELRLSRARELLESTFLRVKEIGVKVGMPDESHFTRDFKNRFGSSPVEYRRKYWERVQFEDRLPD
jgi:AraC family transcriptional regulator, L-rhamnose operon transcriptional activator RhaR